MLAEAEAIVNVLFQEKMVRCFSGRTGFHERLPWGWDFFCMSSWNRFSYFGNDLLGLRRILKQNFVEFLRGEKKLWKSCNALHFIAPLPLSVGFILERGFLNPELLRWNCGLFPSPFSSHFFASLSFTGFLEWSLPPQSQTFNFGSPPPRISWWGPRFSAHELIGAP